MTKIPTLKLLVLCVGVGFAGCTEPNPRSCADDFCDDPAFPFCDVDGSIGGTPNTCVAVQCTPLAFEGCRGDEALFCDADGTTLDVTQCEFGCDPLSGCKACEPGAPGCDSRIAPLYVPDICEVEASSSTFTITTTTTLDTSDGASCNGGVIAQASGPELCVVRHGEIRLDRNATLKVVGTRALVLAGDRIVSIDGILDVSADGPVNGPGGGTITSGVAVADAPLGGGGAGPLCQRSCRIDLTTTSGARAETDDGVLGIGSRTERAQDARAWRGHRNSVVEGNGHPAADVVALAA